MNYTLGSPRTYNVRYSHALENAGASPATAHLWVPLPSSALNQVVSVGFDPPTSVLTDNWGQAVAYYSLSLAGYERRVLSWSARLAISDISFSVNPAVTLAGVPLDILVPYTADDEKFVLSSSVVQQAAADAVSGCSTLYERILGISQYVMDHLYYLKEGGWDDAATVLTRGNGSCSEYAYVTIALLRANGIPSRMVGGARNRNGGDYTDTVFHRACEVFLPDYDWVPVDTDLADTQGRPIFTRYADHFIFQSSGGRSSLLRWDYRSRYSVASLTAVSREAQWSITAGARRMAVAVNLRRS